MANKIMQFRYYGEKVSNNQPSNISASNLASGHIFSGYLPITQLGIQTLPGTKFYLNNGNDPIIIGSTGIYELDLEGQTEITQIQMDGGSMKTINDNDSAYLIIDIIYDNGKE